MNLLIVESPGKCKKIKSILGQNWVVKASVGHIRNLPVRDLGFDRDTLRPVYEEMADKKKVIKELRGFASNAREVYLATDLDREGEGIAWHIKEVLGLKGNYKRVVFKEITKAGINEGMSKPRKLDNGLVLACEARRLLDRMVGYMVSPELCKAYDNKLSAGRVQTPAVLLVVLREKEIQAFVSKPCYEVELEFESAVKSVLTDDMGTNSSVNMNDTWKAKWNWKRYAAVVSPGEDLQNWTDKSSASQAAAVRDLRVVNLQRKNVQRNPPSPFTTSTLQQAASASLKINPKKCMQLAQKLYEGGFITYHRTDATFLSNEALGQINDYLINNGLSSCVLDKPNVWKSKDGAQEAHECIRPSNIADRTIAFDDSLGKKLYEMIWLRTVASQMKSAVYDAKKITLESIGQIDGQNLEYIAFGRTVKFPGWLRLTDKDYTENSEDKSEATTDAEQTLPDLDRGEEITAIDGKLLNKKTKPPKRYTEASLVKELEAEGIGRPSTYATIMDNIIARGYVEIKARKLQATTLGISIIETLSDKFDFCSVDYTRGIEEQLDKLTQGQADYHRLMRNVYEQLENEITGFGTPTIPGFSKDEIGYLGQKKLASGKKSKKSPTAKANAKSSKKNSDTRYPCLVCGSGFMHKRQGKTPFWGCSNYPKCKNTYPDKNGKPEIVIALDIPGVN